MRMVDRDLRAEYRALPPGIDRDDMVTEISTGLTEVEHGGKPDPDFTSCE
jgi:hypothetical protein